MATNRIDSLDPALIRPGRIDRKIEFPLPDEKTKRRIFNIHTSKMTLSTCVKVDEYILAKDDLSGADIKAICTEAGLMALRYVLHSYKIFNRGLCSCDPRHMKVKSTHAFGGKLKTVRVVSWQVKLAVIYLFLKWHLEVWFYMNGPPKCPA